MEREKEKPCIVRGRCFCGNVTFEVLSLPVLSAYCHCTQCQRLTACPFVHTMHFDETAFRWTMVQDVDTLLDSYDNPLKPHKRRYRCKGCGVCVVSHNSITRRYSVWGGTLERDGDSGRILDWEKIKPTAHQFYGTRVIDVNDGLGKWEGYEGKSENIWLE